MTTPHTILGQGDYRREWPASKCSTCNGRGRFLGQYPEACVMCDGTGFVRRFVTPNASNPPPSGEPRTDAGGCFEKPVKEYHELVAECAERAESIAQRLCMRDHDRDSLLLASSLAASLRVVVNSMKATSALDRDFKKMKERLDRLGVPKP